MTNKRVQLWALNLSGYNCRMEYIKGKHNYCADLLSRVPEDISEPTRAESQEQDDVPDINDNTLEINEASEVKKTRPVPKPRKNRQDKIHQQKESSTVNAINSNKLILRLLLMPNLKNKMTLSNQQLTYQTT